MYGKLNFNPFIHWGYRSSNKARTSNLSKGKTRKESREKE
jgi:hypothetical protein